MSIPLQFASLYDGQEVFVWSDCLLELGTDFLVGNMLLRISYKGHVTNEERLGLLGLNVQQYLLYSNNSNTTLQQAR